MKNNRMLVICGILTIVITLLLSNFNSFTELRDVTVDQNNGNVAYVYYDSRRSCLILQSYDKNGKYLYGKSFGSGGGGAAYVQYVNSELLLYICREDVFYKLDASGNILSKDTSPDLNDKQIKSLREKSWKGWDDQGRIKQYTLGDAKYIYEVSPFFQRLKGKGMCELYMLDENGNKISFYKGK